MAIRPQTGWLSLPGPPHWQTRRPAFKVAKAPTQYFQELVPALAAPQNLAFVLDGEIVMSGDGGLSSDHLLERIHPAASRIEKLCKATPAVSVVFDLLVDDKGKFLATFPLPDRRKNMLRIFSYPRRREKRTLHLLSQPDISCANDSGTRSSTSAIRSCYSAGKLL